MKHINAILLIVLAVCVHDQVTAQVFITSSSSGVHLQWTPDSTEHRTYIIYRRLATDVSFSRVPYARVTAPTCSVITTRLERDSALERLVVSAALMAGQSTTTTSRALLACTALTGAPSTPEYQLLRRLSKSYFQLADVMGAAYTDASVIIGRRYVYDVRYMESRGREVSVTDGAGVAVTAGQPIAVPVPTNVMVTPGDGQIMLRWTAPTDSTPPLTAEIQRSESASNWTNPYRRIVLGSEYVDFNGTAGLTNGREYFYRLRFISGRDVVGPFTTQVAVRPIDQTPPVSPRQVTAEEQSTSRTVTVRWNRTYFDTRQKPETMGEYKVFRVPSEETDINRWQLLGAVSHQSGRADEHVQSFIDRDPPYDPCRNTSTSYAVISVDANGNVSTPSAPFQVALPDRVPPQPVTGLSSESSSTTITLHWKRNIDCGIRQYNVYRALCDFGSWIPCPENETPQESIRYVDHITKTKPKATIRRDTSNLPVICGGPFVLIATVEHVDGTESYTYVDESIPRFSPLCYAYVISAVDTAGNQSVSFPIPNPSRDRIICANLIDVRAPMDGVINRLVVGENNIMITASTPAQQDVAGFYLYRAMQTDSALTNYTFMQARYLDAGTGLYGSSVTRLPVNHDDPVSCDVIPQGKIGTHLQVDFSDSAAVDRVIYHYKVTVVDRNGNESRLDSAVDMSTFTYGRTIQTPVTITAVRPTPDGGSLEITVRVGNPIKPVRAIVVYRSTSRDGEYQQIVPAQPAFILNTAVDRSARRGRTYWYRAMVVHSDFSYTDLCPPMQGVLP